MVLTLWTKTSCHSQLNLTTTPLHNQDPHFLIVFNKVHEQICQEIECASYIVTDKRPTIVSPLATLEKDNGSVRLIMDCSYPEGKSLNGCATFHKKQ